MCLLFLAIDAHPDYRIVAAANRDEFYARPTRRMHVWEDHDHVIAGRDLERGGTWFGVTRRGRWAAVTNYREAGQARSATSRGALVTNFLASGAEPEDYVSEIAADAGAYSGFNLIAGTTSRAVYFSNRDNEMRPLGAGIYGLSNHLLDTPWPKVDVGKRSLLGLTRRKHLDRESLYDIMNNGKRAADEELPESGVGIEWERLLSSAFVSGDDYGTRSSTIFLVNRHNRLKLEERTYDPDAPGTLAGYSSVAYEFDIQH